MGSPWPKSSLSKEAHCPENSMAQRIMTKMKRKSPVSFALLAAVCAIGACTIVFALDSVTGNENTGGRDRSASLPRNDGSYPFPVQGSRRIKGEDEHLYRKGERKPNEMNAFDDREVVSAFKRATDSRLNVEQSRKLNRKNGSDPSGALSGQSSGGTSYGSSNNPNGEKGGRTSFISDRSTSGRANDQSKGHARFGGRNKKRGAKTNGTKFRTKKGGTNDSPKIAAMTNNDEATSMLTTMETPQQMSEVMNLNTMMNTATASTRNHNSATADSFLTTFNSKFDAKKKGGKKKKNVGSAGYDLPGIYAESSTSSWGSTGGGKQDGWGGSDMKPAGWSKLPDELVHEYKNACPCVYIDAPSWGSSWGGPSSSSSSVGITPLSAKTQGIGTEAGSTLGREGSSWDGPSSGSSTVNVAPFAGMTLNTGTWVGSTSGAPGGPTLGTKSSKKSKVEKTDSKARKLQWGGAQHQPEKVLVCTCVPTYFPTYNPT